MLIGLFYVVGFVILLLITLGLIWWGKWILAVAYAFVPIMGVLWALWAFLIALPMAILFDGSYLERKVVIISHHLNDFTWWLFCLACTAPFKIIGLIIDILYWCVH